MLDSIALLEGTATLMGGIESDIYEHLRRVAGSYLRHQRPGHTLEPTALVHEAWLKLRAGDQERWRSKAHFLRTAALAMRQVLVNSAHQRKTLRRGGDAEPIPLEDALFAFESRCVDILALDDALRTLRELDPLQCDIVELRFFGGLTVEETAAALGVAVRKVERSWRAARAWLKTEIAS